MLFDYGFGVLEQIFRLRNGEEIEPARLTSLTWRALA
jgi:hypothetical protein